MKGIHYLSLIQTETSPSHSQSYQHGRNAIGGESTGPIPVDKPRDAFADDQLGLLDHLGVRQFVFFGNCIGGSFALKLMQRAPDRLVAGVLCQPVGHRPEDPDVMYRSGREA